MPLEVNTDPTDVAGPDEKTVLDPKTNTTIAFPQTMSDDEIAHHMQSDPMAPSNVQEWNPDFYTKEFRPALESSKNVVDPVLMAKSFVQNAGEMASFNFYKPSKLEQQEEHAFAPGSAMAGQFAGFVPWAFTGQAINKYIGSLALANPAIAGFLSDAFTGTIAKFGLEGAEKASQIATGAAGSGALMAEYTGISDVGKKDFQDTSVDMAKEFGMWGAAGGVAGAIAKPLSEMMGPDKFIEASKQMAATGATLAAITKINGGDDKDVWLAFGLGAIAHGASLMGDEGGNKAVLDDVQRLNTQYVQAKNQIIDPSIAHAVADAHLQNEAQEVLQSMPPQEPTQENVVNESSPLDQVAQSGEATTKLITNIASRVLGGEESSNTPHPTVENTSEAVTEGNAVDQSMIGKPAEGTAESLEGKEVSSPESIAQEDKVAKASSDINDALVKKGFDELSPEEKATFTPITKEATTKKVSDFINSDENGAKDMAAGRIPFDAEKAGHPQVLFNAVKNKAIKEGDAQTLKDLAKSPHAKARSEAAQTLAASGFDNGTHDPVKIIQDIDKSRGTKFKKDNITKTVKKMQDIVNKSKPKLKDWNAFIESIKC